MTYQATVLENFEPAELSAGQPQTRPGFLADAATVLGAQAGRLTLALLLEVCYARLLGPTGRGQISLCNMAIGACALLGGFGGEIPFMVWAANPGKARLPWVPSVLFMGTVGAAGAMGLWAALFWEFQPAFLQGVTSPLAWLVLACIPASIFGSYGLAWLTGQQRLRERSAILVVSQAAILVVTLVLLFSLGRRPEAAMLAVLTGSIVAILVTCWLLASHAAPLLRGWRKLGSQLGAAMSLGVRGQLGNVATFFNYRLDVFIVNFFLNPAQVGLYAIGVLVAESLWHFADAAAVALVPRTARGAHDQSPVFTCQVTRQVFLLACVSGLAIAALSPLAIPLAFGEKFAASVRVVWWLLPGTVALAAGKVMSADLTARGMPQYSSMFAFVALVITVVLDLLLIPRIGIEGAAIASSAAYLTDAVLVASALQWKLGVSWKALYVPTAIDLTSYRQAWGRALAALRPSTIS